MILSLHSDQFELDEGDVVIVSTAGRLMTDPVSLKMGLKSNRIVGMPDVEPGDIVLCVQNCAVTSRRSGEKHTLPFFSIHGHVRAGASQDTAMIDVPFHSRLRVRVANSDGQPLSTAHVVGVATGQGTFEMPVTAAGDVEVLIEPGIVTVYLHSHPEVNTHLVVSRENEDSGTISLVVPGNRK